MCGFFGVVQGDKPLPEEVLRHAASHVAWRGLDENGVYPGQLCYLAHYRLSIIDLDTGSQPMADRSGRYVIAYNGELYNYRELRRDLEAAGCEFVTRSDTEVFLAGLALDGADFLKKAEGMYAAALWDKQDKALTLVRDPLGKKPLYVWPMPGGGLAFSSGPAAFRMLPGWRGEIDLAAMVFFLNTGAIPPPLSIYTGCEKLEPGTMRTHWARGAAKDTVRYTRLAFGSRQTPGPDDILDSLRRALDLRTRADVPLAMTFSGGVDSGLLAGLCADLGYDMRLFNIDYETSDRKSPERANARRAAKIFGLELIEEDFVPDRIFINLPNAYAHYEEPSDALALVYFYEILKAIGGHGIKVVLTGNGADEVFFGYRGDERVRLRSDLMRLALPAVPSALMPEALKKLKAKGWPAFLMDKERGAIAGLCAALGLNAKDVLPLCGPVLWSMHDSVKRAGFQRYSDYHMWRSLFIGNVSSNFLMPDVSGMHAQVEVRAPFLDWRFIRGVADIRDSMRIGSYFSHRKNKAVLKKLYAARVGPELAYDKKRGMGWNIRFDQWIRQEPVKSLFRSAMLGLGEYGLDPAWALGHFDAYCAGADSAGDFVVRSFMLYAWLKREHTGDGALRQWLEPVSGFKPGGGGHE